MRGNVISRLRTLDRLHVDGHGYPMGAATEHDSLQRAHVAEVAAPGDRDVPRAGERAVRRVEVEPTETGHVHRGPRVRRVGADETRLARRWFRFEVAGHVARGEAERTQAADGEMGE